MRTHLLGLVLGLALHTSRVESLEPLLESNAPPYTLVNFALETDPRIDQIGELQKQASVSPGRGVGKAVQQNRRTRLGTQFSQRREWLDMQFDKLRRKQQLNREGRVPWGLMRWTRRVLAAIRPSGLAVRPPRTAVCDDSRNVNKALRSIRKELGVDRLRESSEKVADGHAGVGGDMGGRVDAARLNLRSKLHRGLWLAMKRRDRPQFLQAEKQLRASDVEMDGVSYTLLVHGHLLFGGQGEYCLGLLQEMRDRGIHPSLIRFNARIVASCSEMGGLGARPLASNIVQMARAAWLTAVLVTRRYPTRESILRMEAEIEERQRRPEVPVYHPKVALLEDRDRPEAAN